MQQLVSGDLGAVSFLPPGSVLFSQSTIMQKNGVSLIEVLLGLLVVTIASIATLTYFSSALGNVNKQGNRRAALERARQRLERLMEVNATTIQPTDGQLYFVSCNNAGACGPPVLVNPNNTVAVDDVPSLPLQSTVQCIHDPAAGTPNGTCDVLELSAKVWFIPGSNLDDDFNRVHIRTLRTPS